MGRFYICNHCQNIIELIEDKGVSVYCCKEAMKELAVNTSDAVKEKHMPVVTVKKDHVDVVVGNIIHPMEPAHHISWIYLKTKKGSQRKVCIDSPTASFKLVDDEAVAVYEYCNIHGLWRYEIE